MALVWQGNGGVNADVDTDRNLRTVIKPAAFGALGYYQVAQVTGTIAASLAANSTLFSFRWGSATDLCLIQSVKVGAFITTAAGAAGSYDLAMFVARTFTASDSGGTSILPTSNGNKLRTSMGTTLVTDMRISTTGTLTPGTRTLDTNPIARIQGDASTTIDSQVFPGFSPTPMFVRDNVDHHPLVLAQNEGFVITNPIAGPATETYVVLVQVTWGEVAAF